MTRPRHPLVVVGLAVTVATALLAACGHGGGGAGDGQLTVLAAASLTGAMTELGEAFEQDHPGTRVQVSFTASSAAREQVLAGAPADVFASADGADVEALVDQGRAEHPQVFATNRLMIVVPEGNPAAITGLADLAEPSHLVGLCAPSVPCGRLAREALDAAGVDASPDTEAPDVRALLTQVASGDLDVGIVYASDVEGDDRVEGIPLPPSVDREVQLVIAPLVDAEDADVARALVDFVRSADGRAILLEHGFGLP